MVNPSIGHYIYAISVIKQLKSSLYKKKKALVNRGITISNRGGQGYDFVGKGSWLGCSSLAYFN